MRNEDKFLGAAKHAFVTQGFREVTVWDILHTSNISESTLRRHFSGLKDVYKKVLRNTAAEVAERFLAAVSELDFQTPIHLVEQYISTVNTMYEEESTKESIVLLFGRDGRLSSSCVGFTETEMDDFYADLVVLRRKLAESIGYDAAALFVEQLEGLVTVTVARGRSFSAKQLMDAASCLLLGPSEDTGARVSDAAKSVALRKIAIHAHAIADLANIAHSS
jgi:AcrR family transcriptional regulator